MVIHENSNDNCLCSACINRPGSFAGFLNKVGLINASGLGEWRYIVENSGFSYLKSKNIVKDEEDKCPESVETMRSVTLYHTNPVLQDIIDLHYNVNGYEGYYLVMTRNQARHLWANMDNATEEFKTGDKLLGFTIKISDEAPSTADLEEKLIQNRNDKEWLERLLNNKVIDKKLSPPFKCPNCDGVGRCLVRRLGGIDHKNQIQAVHWDEKECPSCNGKGIVWRE